MTAVEVHARLANAALYYFLIVAIWGYLIFFRRRSIDPGYRGALFLGILLLVAQSGLGAYLWLVGLRPARTVHILYGVVSIMAIPLAYTYTRGRMERSEALIYGTTTLITVGLVLRAITTAV